MNNSEYEEFSEVIDILQRNDQTSQPENPPTEVWNSIYSKISEEKNLIAHSTSADTRQPTKVSFFNWSLPKLSFAFGLAALIAAAVVSLLIINRGAITKEADLLALGEYTGQGYAYLSDDDSLRIEIEQLEPIAEHTYELWLLQVDPNNPEIVVDLKSLGSIENSDEYDIAQIDASQYSVVDISIEPDDGDPAHSGNSILRGQLNQI